MTQLSPRALSHPQAAVLALLAALTAANALWMLADPSGWFATLPGVSHTGPFNVHLVRDVGCAYLTMAALLLLPIRFPASAYPLLLGVTVFLSLHGLLHLWDMAAGRLPLSHLLSDLPGVLLPPFLAFGLARWLRRPTTSAPGGRS